MTSNQKLLLGVLAAPLVGALLFYLTAGGRGGAEQVAPAGPQPDEPAPLVELTTPDLGPEEDEEVVGYMNARWGHLGDAGAATPHMDPTGDMFFVVPRVFRGRGADGKPIYARAFAKPTRLGPTVRASQAGVRMPDNADQLKAWDPGALEDLQEILGPIDDPNDLPPGLQKEHPLHPDYDGPLGNG